MTVKIDAHELDELVRNLRDPKKLAKVTENSLFNASQVIATSAKKKHFFTSRSFKLENSIFTDVKGLKSEIFVPIDGPLGVAYAGWINEGSRRTSTGKTAIWNNGKGDPFIEKAFIRDEKKFIKTFQDDLVEGIEDFI